jgi:4-alpha-glucanotransferase
LHITSLPSGRLGADAFRFADWLAAAGQSWWQVLPVGPPDRSRSPYRARSAFAAWRGLLEQPASPVSAAESADFRERHAFWAHDWERFAGAPAIADQVRFEREWGALRRYCAERGIRMIGDVPIYVAPHCADRKLHPELFLDEYLAGAPPDAYSATGQLWSSPLYNWPAHRRRSYRWWTERLRRTFDLFDLARIDHFRGFVACWAVPEGARNAAHGHWRLGPGSAPFDAAHRALGTLPLIAEDLGVITKPVVALRRRLGIPGMAVLQFAFGADQHAQHEPRNHEADAVAYTGTHDQDTLLGWWRTLPAGERARARSIAAAAGLRDRDDRWLMIRLLLSSPAPIAMVQLPDVLGLGSEARMNVPGRASGNWAWRLQRAPSRAHALRLRAAAEEAGRCDSG